MVVIVLVDVLDGTVIVDGANVVEYTLVVVVVIVVDGTFVIVNVAVGVEVTVTGGPATMSKVLIQAKVKPSMIIIQFPENIWLFSSSLPGTLLPEVSIDVTDTVESLYQVDVMSISSGIVGTLEQKYSSPLGLIKIGVISP